jgi:hypothetical protein
LIPALYMRMVVATPALNDMTLWSCTISAMLFPFVG